MKEQTHLINFFHVKIYQDHLVLFVNLDTQFCGSSCEVHEFFVPWHILFKTKRRQEIK